MVPAFLCEYRSTKNKIELNFYSWRICIKMVRYHFIIPTKKYKWNFLPIFPEMSELNELYKELRDMNNKSIK